MLARLQAPKDLVKKYAKAIIEADGFAQVYPEHKASPSPQRLRLLPKELGAPLRLPTSPKCATLCVAPVCSTS